MIEITAKMSMGVLLAAAVPSAGDASLWAQWGLAGLIVAYTLWRDAHRERRMSLALDAQQRWVRDTLVRALERNSAALENITAVSAQNAQEMQRPRSSQRDTHS